MPHIATNPAASVLPSPHPPSVCVWDEPHSQAQLASSPSNLLCSGHAHCFTGIQTALTLHLTRKGRWYWSRSDKAAIRIVQPTFYCWAVILLLCGIAALIPDTKDIHPVWDILGSVFLEWMDFWLAPQIEQCALGQLAGVRTMLGNCMGCQLWSIMLQRERNNSGLCWWNESYKIVNFLGSYCLWLTAEDYLDLDIM